MNILQFIRRKLIPSKYKQFDQQVKGLEEFLIAEFQTYQEEKIEIDVLG